jgi:hypothetical protein
MWKDGLGGGRRCGMWRCGYWGGGGFSLIRVEFFSGGGVRKGSRITTTEKIEWMDGCDMMELKKERKKEKIDTYV